MGHAVGILSLVIVSSVALAADKFDEYNDRIEALEAQVEVSCNLKGEQTDPIRSQIAERVNSEEGSAALLLREVRQHAESANSALDLAEQIVSTQTEPLLQQKRDAAKDKIARALKKLKASISNRAPASHTDDLRDEVKSAYDQYLSLGQDPRSLPTFRGDVKNLRQAKLSELKSLASLGERIGKARKKAYQCFCRTGADICKTQETLATETGFYSSMMAHHAAKRDATAGTTGSGGGSGGSAR